MMNKWSCDTQSFVIHEFMIKASILGILGTSENPLMELTKVKEVKE